MPRFDNPTVLVTRPQAASDRFVEALKTQAGPFRSVICPAFEIVPLTPSTDVPTFEVAVFTSREGVACAPNGSQRTAYCVGPATAQAAEYSGYRAISAGGNVRDLIKMILTDAPRQSLLHIRGEVSIGGVRLALASGGLNCADYVAYRKQQFGPKAGIKALVKAARHLIIPIFSGETVSILIDWNIDFGSAHAVVISPAVATAISSFTPLTTTVSPHPDMGSMVTTTASLIA